MRYETYQNVDWLQYTSKKRFDELGWDYERTWDISESGMNGYEFKGVDKETGIVALWSDKRPDMGTHVILDGACCQWYRHIGLTDSELVLDALQRGKLSRIDIAITSHPSSVAQAHGFRSIEQQKAYSAGLCDTRLTTNTGYTNEGTQRTFYLGKGKKGNKYRGYDKGYELGGVTDFLQRYELQSRKRTASTVGRMVADGADFGDIMNRYIKFNHRDWDMIVGSTKGTITHAPDKNEPDTIGWLRDVCAPALARVALENDNPANVLDWFLANVLEVMKSESAE